MKDFVVFDSVRPSIVVGTIKAASHSSAISVGRKKFKQCAPMVMLKIEHDAWLEEQRALDKAYGRSYRPERHN